jgi:putative transcriptional regulator
MVNFISDKENITQAERNELKKLMPELITKYREDLFKMSEKTLGQELIKAVKGALRSKGRGSIVRPRVNVSSIRKQLHMTQKEFAEKYYIKLQTLRNWEQEKRIPDATTWAYLTCIAHRPKVILKILHQSQK